METKFKLIVLLILSGVGSLHAQVGINTTSPNSMLEVRASNPANPNPNDGLLVPAVNQFPATNPGLGQDGMLLFLKVQQGANQPGFYYWQNATSSWIALLGSGTSGTLNEAYNFGGPGAGNNINAVNGALRIQGTDGILSTGTFNSGAVIPPMSGSVMFWNPRTASFRAGTVDAAQWNSGNIGTRSVAFGENNTANGGNSAAFGQNTRASGYNATSLGFNTQATGGRSLAFGQNTTATQTGSTAFGDTSIASSANATAFGLNTQATGSNSTAFGVSSLASGGYSTAFGNSTQATAARSLAFGQGTIASGTGSTTFGILTTATNFESTAFGGQSNATGHTATAFGKGVNAVSYAETATGMYNTTYAPASTTNWSANDRIFSIGNGLNDGSRSDAMIVQKNGLATLPSVTNALITAESTGKAIVTKEYLQANSSGTLDRSYDFGGAGAGRTITADSGPVTIQGTDGIVSTGVQNSGAVMPSGGGARMVWNPRKAAFRAGAVSGTEWDDANTGLGSTAFGINTTASALRATAFGYGASATNNNATAFGQSTTASGGSSTAFGSSTQATGVRSTAFGSGSIASGINSTAFGQNSQAIGTGSTALGVETSAPAFGETAAGMFNTNYTPVSATAWAATDRIFTVGNGTSNGNRSDAMVLQKNGLATLPSTTNTLISAEPTGKAIVTKEYLQANSSGTLDQSYDFGGAGAGRTITADTGPVTIQGTDGVVSTGTLDAGALMAGGGGTKMVWNPRKAAFRAGYVSGTHWNDANTGQFSVAFGEDNTASGGRSFAMGVATVASGLSSSAFGYVTQATGNESTASGQWTTASGVASFAFGIGTAASASRATAFGASTVASAQSATAFGANTVASAESATAFGDSTTASGLYSTAFGVQSTALGWNSTAFGVGTSAQEANALAFGAYTTASMNNSTAFGMETSATNHEATAFGGQSNASGVSSTAFGKGVNAVSFAETAMGMYNTTYTPASTTAYWGTDRIFSIGNGNNASARSNAMVVLKNGRTGIGTNNPQAPLHVAGVGAVSNAIGIRYFNYGSPPVVQANWAGSTTAYFEGNVMSSVSFIATSMAAFSDERVKKIDRISDAKRDLETLRKIEIVDYTMTDSVADPKKYKKVIAQQVEKLMPDAVSKTSGYVPSIFSAADEVSGRGRLTTVKMAQAHNLVAGDEIKLILEREGELLTTVAQAIDAHTFIVPIETPSEGKLFVYGKKVDDFRAVDYDAIAMLNVSATQELYRLLVEANKQVSELKDQNESLRAEFAEIKSDILLMKQILKTENP